MDALKIEPRSGYIYFFMGADPLTLEEAMSVQTQVLAAMKKHHSKRMLFEKAGEQRKLSMKDYYAMAESFGKLAGGVRVAVLVSPKLETPEVAFFELASGVAGNLLRYFTDFAQAEAWLLQD
jgi:hypothetical protein